MKKFLKKILFNPAIAGKITRLLVKVHQISYTYIGAFASAAEGGRHPNYILMNYHKSLLIMYPKGKVFLILAAGMGHY